MPFTFAELQPTVHKKGRNMLYCLTVTTSECVDPANACCNQALRKIEWWSNLECQGSVRGVYVDGVKVDSQWAPKGVFKITHLNWARGAIGAAGKEVCMELGSTSTCPTLESFCRHGVTRGTCNYALFNDNNDATASCCPTSEYGVV